MRIHVELFSNRPRAHWFNTFLKLIWCVQMNFLNIPIWIFNVRFHTTKLHVGHFWKSTRLLNFRVFKSFLMCAGGFWAKSCMELQWLILYIGAPWMAFFNAHLDIDPTHVRDILRKVANEACSGVDIRLHRISSSSYCDVEILRAL